MEPARGAHAALPRATCRAAVLPHAHVRAGALAGKYAAGVSTMHAQHFKPLCPDRPCLCFQPIVPRQCFQPIVPRLCLQQIVP
eukprot:350618-Chlamydomonas_euryale.AAC.3